MYTDFQLDSHNGMDFPEWGSGPHGPLIQLDMAHRGELLDSVVGMHPVTAEPMVYYILKCEYCILIHAWPIPSEKDLTIFYGHTFYQHEKPDMVSRYEADAAWWSKCMHGPLLDTATLALGQKEGVRILDIGAGPGLLLRNAKARGWYTTAIEPSPLCAERLIASGDADTTWNASLSEYHEMRDTYGSYDIVTIWEGAEHLSCPEDALLQVWDLLRPGGILALCVPNEYTPAQFMARKRFNLPAWWVAPPQHMSYFTPKTLQLMLRRCGFRQYSMRMTFPLIEHFILERGQCYVGNDALGRQCHKERMEYELGMVRAGKWSELESTYIENVQDRIGREIVAIFNKI